MNRSRSASAVSWVFPGLRLAPALRASGARAKRWRADGGEWVRPVVEVADWRRRWAEDGPPLRSWAVDFPPGADERALAEAGAAGRCFQRAGARIVRRGNGAELRIALAKCDRYLARPAGPARSWRWVPAAALPCGRLIVVARDDEFLAGVLASRWLESWCRGRGTAVDVDGVRSFPLPWPADTPRGALSREQEERRDAVVRAWRAAGGGRGDGERCASAEEELSAAVAAAYGWPATLAEDCALEALCLKAQLPARA